MLHFSENCMILASAVLSQYTRVTDRQTTDDDRQYLMEIAELAMQLQRSAKNLHSLKGFGSWNFSEFPKRSTQKGA